MPLPQCTRIRFGNETGREELLAMGWREIEILETWTGPARRHFPERYEVEPAQEFDVERLQKIARASFTHDRLHADPMVPKAEADAAKEKWVHDAYFDPAKSILVARDAMGLAAGFMIYRIDVSGKRAARALIIDLLAVDQNHRRQGIAQQLIGTVCRERGCRRVVAGTQKTNLSARAFYREQGMKVSIKQRTFHRP